MAHTDRCIKNLVPLLGIPIGETWGLRALAPDCEGDYVYDWFLTSAPYMSVPAWRATQRHRHQEGTIHEASFHRLDYVILGLRPRGSPEGDEWGFIPTRTTSK